MATEKDKVRAFYACQNLDAAILEKSSSGGIFFLLAQQTLQNGGVIFGAAFTENFRLCHQRAESAEAVMPLLGSKYLQSAMEDVFFAVKADLAAGRQVLFCGTPCQVAGLKSFLGGGHAALLTVDFICHGVPSPMVFEHYLSSLAGGEIQSISFRDKAAGWKNYAMRVVFAEGETYNKQHSKDDFMLAFLSDNILRPSCHYCQFKLQGAQSDLRLGDFWGAEVHLPNMDDNRGISALIVNTQAGVSAWAAVQGKTRFQPVDEDTMADKNPCLLRPVALPHSRRRFWKHLAGCGYDVAQTMLPLKSKTLMGRVARKLRRMLEGKAPKAGWAAVAVSSGPITLYKNKGNCCGCSACAMVCPVCAIRMEADEEGFLYPAIDEAKCITCEKCLRVCPMAKQA